MGEPVSLSAPAAVRSALRKGLALVREGYAGKGLRGKTVEWAERLANGEPIDYAKAKKMRGWFARHGVAKAESAKRLRDPKSPASVAYLLWGGTPSIPVRKAGWQDPVAPWLRDVIATFESQRAGRRSQKNGRSRASADCMDRVAPWYGVGDVPPWRLTEREFNLRTRRYFHGSTAANVKRLIAEQKPDAAMYGSRTDKGFFGEGFYTTTTPYSSYGKNVLAVEVRLDASILEWSDNVTDRFGFAPSSKPPWFDRMVERMHALAAANGRSMRAAWVASITPGDPSFSHLEFVREAYAYAKASGYDVFQPMASETVILNPNCVTRIYRAAKSFAEAESRYSHAAYVRAATACDVR